MSATQSYIFASTQRRSAFDDLLFEICDELQISKARYDLAEERYKTIGTLLCAPGSPFLTQDPKIYPQGSMRLGTTVRPIDGPFDLDFVCQLSVPYRPEDPMELLDELYSFFQASGRYKSMVERKNRCVRIVYADEFYMDILPACLDTSACGTCIQVPDRELRGWKGSNPIGYAQWFQERSRRRMYKFAASSELQPLPALEATEEKEVLQLVVQLLKRWRDLFYADSQFPPISVVLTTLAADLYLGEESTSEALLNVLDGIVDRIEVAGARNKRLPVPNPVHTDEDFSERWDNRDTAYAEFATGIRRFAERWREVCTSGEDPKPAFVELFGKVVPTVLEKRARRTQALREGQKLGVLATGVLAPASVSVTSLLPNTNHGDEGI